MRGAEVKIRQLAMLVLGGLVAGCGKMDEVERTIGYLGKARANPFLAAQRFLGAYDFDAKVVGRLSEMPDSGVVLFAPAEAISSQGTADRFISWVRKGGHLIYAIDGANGFQNDFEDVIVEESKQDFGNKNPDNSEQGTESAEAPAEIKAEQEEAPRERGKEVPPTRQSPAGESSKKKKKSPAGKIDKEDKDDKEEEVRHPLLSSVGVTIPEESIGKPGETLTLSLLGETLRVGDRSGLPVQLGRTLRPGEFSLGEPQSSKLLSIRLGQGRVTIIPDAWFWRNRFIGDQDHAALLLGVVGEDGHAFWVLRGADVSFFGLLWHHGWQVVIAILLLLGLWLWRELSRFGKILESRVQDEVKDFSAHVGMVGRFLWNQGQSSALIQAARDRLRRLVEGKLFAGTLAGDEIVVSRLSEVGGVPIERVRAVWSGPPPMEPNAFVHFMQDLQQIESRL
ncbi:MAG: DUF4350 domain-containing protein [Verrucomicrobiales bacterium]|nr:DUF4350 domain-containing protein [Verrucomicrobiales bacterium]